MESLPKTNTHVVDVLGNVIGRDQPILKMDKAIEMVSLLSSDVFLDKNIVFFDPFCKAGELLLACAYMSCVSKVKKRSQLMDTKEIYKEIFESDRYFALAPDERHHRLSLRTFLGNTNSHNEKYNYIIRNGNYLSETDGKLDKKRFEKEFADMIEYIKERSGNKKIIAIGNPPYHEEDGGAGRSSKQLFNIFTESTIESGQVEELVFVIPSKWFSSGKGLGKFRKKISTSRKVKYIRYFEHAQEVFPAVQVKGGVLFLYWSKNYNGSTTFNNGDGISSFDLTQCDDAIPDDPHAISIIEKVKKIWKGKFVSDVARSRKFFGLPTNHFKKTSSLKPSSQDAVRCLTQGRIIKYANIKDIKNHEKIDRYKVAIPKAYGSGMRRCTIPEKHIFIIDKGIVTTETFNIIEFFENRKEAENFKNYLRSSFSRYLLGLRKLTQDIPKDRWGWVPLLDFQEKWTDDLIYNFFKLSKYEVNHIETKVQEWS